MHKIKTKAKSIERKREKEGGEKKRKRLKNLGKMKVNLNKQVPNSVQQCADCGDGCTEFLCPIYVLIYPIYVFICPSHVLINPIYVFICPIYVLINPIYVQVPDSVLLTAAIGVLSSIIDNVPLVAATQVSSYVPYMSIYVLIRPIYVLICPIDNVPLVAATQVSLSLNCLIYAPKLSLLCP